MEFIERFKDNYNNFTDKIKDSKYLEGSNQILKTQGFEDICGVLFQIMKLILNL